MVEYVLRDGDGNVISSEDDAEDVGYNEDTAPDPDPEPEEDDSGGGTDTGSSSTTEPVNEDQLNNEPLDIGEVKQPEDYNRENTDVDQTGPETVEVKKSVTVEDQNTRVPIKDGGKVSRAEQITKEAEAEENRRNLQETAEFLEERGRETEAAEFREQAQAIRQQEKQLEQGIQEITELDQRNEAIQERNFQRQVNQFQRENLEDQLGRPSRFPEAKAVSPRNNPLNNAAEDFFNPNRQVNEKLDFSEEAVLAGQDIIRRSEQGAQQIAEQVPLEQSFTPISSKISGVEQLSRGNTGKAAADLFIPGSNTGVSKRRARQLEKGTFAGPGTLAGFTLGGTGAVATSIEEGTTRRDLVQGSSKIASQASENPGRFAATEIGEEIGEGIATAGIGALTPTITPEITPEVTVPRKVQTANNFVRGNLGTSIENEIITERPIPENQEVLGATRTRNIENFEDGTRIQEAREIRPAEETVRTGRRTETPVTRTEFLRDRLNLDRFDKPSDLVDTGNTLGTGAGGFVPETKTPETETTPENLGETDSLFRERQTSQNTAPDTVQLGVPTPRRGSVIPELENSLDQRQNLDQNRTPFETFDNIFENISTIQQPETNTDNRFEQGLTSTPTLDNRLEQFFGTTPTNSLTTTTTATPETGENQSNGNNFFDLLSREQDRDVNRSVGADLLGLEGRELSETEATNPLSLRALDQN